MTIALRPALCLGASTLALTLSVACGGNVAVDHVHGGTTVTVTVTTTGAGGGGSTTTTGTTTGTTTSTTITTTTTGTTTVDPDICSRLCKVLLDSGCEAGTPGECVSQCNQSLVEADECAPALSAVYACYEPYLPQCPKDPPVACSGQLQAYTDCIGQGGTCSSPTCSAGGGPNGQEFCDCQQTCNGRFIEASCETHKDTTVCSCVINGAQVGTCSGSASKDPCNLQVGCCAALF
jgi:hypothetical protein